jgi:magnesium-transporting ATPase (P-type)
MAYKELPKRDKYTQEDSESEMTFLGFMAMIDPPRAEVA